jgi:hypothetical protein
VADQPGRLYAADIAARLGISESTWRGYVSRGQAPRPDHPDGPYEHVRGRIRAVWAPATIEAYIAARRAPRARKLPHSTG